MLCCGSPPFPLGRTPKLGEGSCHLVGELNSPTILLQTSQHSDIPFEESYRSAIAGGLQNKRSELSSIIICNWSMQFPEYLYIKCSVIP